MLLSLHLARSFGSWTTNKTGPELASFLQLRGERLASAVQCCQMPGAGRAPLKSAGTPATPGEACRAHHFASRRHTVTTPCSGETEARPGHAEQAAMLARPRCGSETGLVATRTALASHFHHTCVCTALPLAGSREARLKTSKAAAALVPWFILEA